MDFHRISTACFWQPIEKFQPVFVIMEEGQLFDSPVDDMIDDSGNINAWGAGHSVC